jgi:hypothetical protein
MTTFLLSVFNFSIFLSSFGLTNGPFFDERDIFSYLTLLRAATRGTTPDDKAVSALVLAGALAEGRLAPRSLWTGHTDTRTPFTTTMRVTGRVHRDTAHGWTPTHPAPASCFAELDVAVIGIADLTDCCHTALVDKTNFTTRQAYLSVNALFRQKLR